MITTLDQHVAWYIGREYDDDSDEAHDLDLLLLLFSLSTRVFTDEWAISARTRESAAA